MMAPFLSGVQLLEGNKSDVTTVVNNMKNLQQRIRTKDYVTIMDRGMVSGDNLHCLMESGVGFIAAIPLKGRGDGFNAFDALMINIQMLIITI